MVSETLGQLAPKKAMSSAERALEMAGIATFEWDVVNNRVYANSLMAAFYGIPEAEIAGGPIESYLSAIHAEDREAAISAIELGLTSGNRYESEYRITDSRSEERWVRAQGDTTVAADGAPLSLSGVVVDITAQKEQERLNEALTREREKLHLLFKNAPAFIAVLRGRDLVFEYVNDHYNQIVGHRPVVGLPLAEALPEVVGGAGEGQDYDRLLLSVMDSNKPVTFKERPGLGQRVPGGPLEPIFLDLAYQPLQESDGTVSGVLVHGVDVTEQVIARQRIAESEQRYRTLFTSMDEGYCVVEIILDGSGKPADYRFLEINEAFERLTGIPAEWARSDKTARELVPGLEDYWVDLYGTVALTGVPARVTQGSEAMGRWFDVRAVRIGDAGSLQVAIIFNDSSEQRKAQLTLELERQQFRRLLDEVPGHVVTLSGPDLRYEFANRAFLDFVGTDDFLGKRAEEAWPVPEDHLAMLRGILETGIPVSGTEVPVQGGLFDFIFHPLREADGSISGVFVHSIDVSEKVGVREALIQAEERFRIVQETTPDGFNMMRPLRNEEGKVVDLVYTYANPALERLVGLSKENLLGRSVLEIRPSLRDSGLFEAFVRLVETGEPFTRELFIEYGPSPRHLRLTSVLVDDEIANSITDITDMKLTELELARALEALKASNDELESKVAERTEELKRAVSEAEGFNYSISHDLRAPLRAIIASASILLEEASDALSPEHRHLLVRQAENANRLGRLIDELLRLSRLSRVEVRREPLDITRIAKAVAADMEVEYGDCRFEIQEGMSAMGDSNLTRNILENLIGNACKFSPRGGEVRVSQEGDVFSVSDQGVGFDMRYAARIFQPFERLVAESEFPGTGIGLANVKRIVERHGGKVWAESEPGKGATFFFTLA